MQIFKIICIMFISFGCSPAQVFTLPKNDFECTKSHTYTYYVPIIIGKTTIMQPQIRTICDVYTRK